MPLILCLIWLAPPASYARPELLAEAKPFAAELAKPMPPLVIDCRPRADYRIGHIPGALNIDAESWAAAFGEGMAAADWSKRIGNLGIAADRRIVVYDAANSLWASHTWWVLRYWGVRDVRVLNGGLTAWIASGGALEVGEIMPKPATYMARSQASRHARKADLLDAISQKTRQIIDTRSDGEFDGSKPTPGGRAGAIPTAKHLEWHQLLDPVTRKFLPSAELASRLQAAGIALDQPCITYCQGGVRASVMAFALELSGAAPVRNYHASWAEWGSDPQLPIMPPRKP